MKYYRETLFNRALGRLVTDGGFRAAYLLNAGGLFLAAVSAVVGRQEEFEALTVSSASVFARADAVGLGESYRLTVEYEGGGSIIFDRFKHRGESEDTYLLAVVAYGIEYDRDALGRAVAELREVLGLFY